MEFIYKIVSKWSFKVLFLTFIVVGILAFFVKDISLSTGNETLIEEETSTYQDNYLYQKTFGTDPIMIVFENENTEALLQYESLVIVEELSRELHTMEGVFYVNSPIGVIDYAVSNSYEMYQTGLLELGNGLLVLSTTMSEMSLMDESLNPTMLLETFTTLSNAQALQEGNLQSNISALENMKENLLLEITRLEDEKAALDPVLDEEQFLSMTQTVGILNNIDALFGNVITMNHNLATGSVQTKTALDQITVQLSSMFSSISTVESNLSMLPDNLEVMGNTLLELSQNFNMFEPGFPQEEDTLNKIIYMDGEINPMLQMYLIEEENMYMSIILKESVSNDEIENIISKVELITKDTMYENVLISGKPVLDYDIQSTMMSSMRVMMMSSVIIMVLVLGILFPVKARLLPLFIVLLAVVTTVGIMGLFSIPLTMVSMAVFPVLIGLGIDYSIQFHSRYMEEAGGLTNEQ